MEAFQSLVGTGCQTSFHTSYEASEGSPVGGCKDAYMSSHRVKRFFEPCPTRCNLRALQSIPPLQRVHAAQRGASSHSWHDSCPRLAALSGQPPKPAGARLDARGVEGESACRAIMAMPWIQPHGGTRRQRGGGGPASPLSVCLFRLINSPSY